MAPPCYGDLGKQARDIFSKSYHFNLIKLDCKTKTSGGMEFNVNGTSNTESGRVSSSLESTYNVPDYGLVLKEKWDTDNVLNTEVSVEEKPLKGMKMALEATFVPQTGKKSAVLKNSFKAEHINVNSDVDVDVKTPILNISTVLGLKGWLVGVQASADVVKSKLHKLNFALGYETSDFVLHTNVNDGQEFGGSVYQKVNDKLETGVQLAWSSGSNATTFGLGCVYTLDSDTSLRAKINNTSQIGLGISHRLREGIRLTLSAMVDGRSFHQGGHKLGVGLELEA